jgi:hypothetical protein
VTRVAACCRLSWKRCGPSKARVHPSPLLPHVSPLFPACSAAYQSNLAAPRPWVSSVLFAGALRSASTCCGLSVQCVPYAPEAHAVHSSVFLHALASSSWELVLRSQQPCLGNLSPVAPLPSLPFYLTPTHSQPPPHSVRGQPGGPALIFRLCLRAPVLPAPAVPPPPPASARFWWPPAFHVPLLVVCGPACLLRRSPCAPPPRLVPHPPIPPAPLASA